MSFNYQLFDDGGVNTIWDMPFKLSIGSTFKHEFGTYRVDGYKDEHIVCERIAKGE
jgi:hypothetical protein|tara:strand:- start:5334 stop:5501 length:168 start_codon:yes stop_codon:yes gene_type:complete